MQTIINKVITKLGKKYTPCTWAILSLRYGLKCINEDCSAHFEKICPWSDGKRWNEASKECKCDTEICYKGKI